MTPKEEALSDAGRRARRLLTLMDSRDIPVLYLCLTELFAAAPNPQSGMLGQAVQQGDIDTAISMMIDATSQGPVWQGKTVKDFKPADPKGALLRQLRGDMKELEAKKKEDEKDDTGIDFGGFSEMLKAFERAFDLDVEPPPKPKAEWGRRRD